MCGATNQINACSVLMFWSHGRAKSMAKTTELSKLIRVLSLNAALGFIGCLPTRLSCDHTGTGRPCHSPTEPSNGAPHHSSRPSRSNGSDPPVVRTSRRSGNSCDLGAMRQHQDAGAGGQSDGPTGEDRSEMAAINAVGEQILRQVVR